MAAGLENGDGKPFNQEGWYRQKETGQEIYLENKTPEYGSPMIDAFIKAGWVLFDKPAAVAPEVAQVEKVSKK